MKPSSASRRPRGEGFVPLRVRSNHSLLSGASSIDALLDRAKASGIGTIALTDESNLYGAVPFFRKARARRISPVLGAIVDAPDGEVALLVGDREGYANLCEIISKRRLDPRFSLAGGVPPHQSGLFVMAHDAALLERLARDVERSRLVAEVIRPSASVNAERELVAAARKLDVDVVASVDAYFADDADFELHEAMAAMRLGTTLEEAKPRVASHEGCRLRSPEEMSRLFSDMPDAVEATARVAEACEFDLLAIEPAFPKV
ncbi:MAG: PHP domain-containing protein, partial [Planctomycetota bacterium]